MSDYDLIPQEAYEDLPADPNDQFSKLVAIAQSNMSRLMDNSNSGDFVSELRSQFIFTISSIADELGIEGLPKVEPAKSDYDSYVSFQIYLSGVVARVRLQGKLVARPHSVELGRINKAKIQNQLNKLRDFISASDLSEDKKDALMKKIAKLQAELDKQRVGFGRVMEVMAAIAPYAVAAPGFIADMPEAKEVIMNVISLVGQDKEIEETERLRLAPPVKQIPHFSADNGPADNSPWGGAQVTQARWITKGSTGDAWAGSETDDDIPF